MKEKIMTTVSTLMIFSGVFTVLVYVKWKVENNLMKICLVINSVYGIVGIAVFGLMTVSRT